MRRVIGLAVILAAAASLAAQAPDKELVAVISGPALARGLVTGLAWDGGALIIQTVGVNKDGSRAARYFTSAGPGMELRQLAEMPAGVERYWGMKASRTSPNGTGRILIKGDAKLPLYGVGSQERRLQDATDMGGAQTTFELRLGDLVLHRRAGTEPYDGEVWSWSPVELGRVAYVNEKGELWIARADGTGAELVLKGRFTLPAWSGDGLVLAVAERKDDGAKWEVSVIHLPERHRRSSGRP